MKRRKAGRGKVWWWGPLMLGAFLAGLLTTGIVILRPGGESSTVTTVSPAQGEPAAPNEEIAQTGPATARESLPVGMSREEGPTPRLAIVVDGCGYDPTRDAEWLKFPEKVTLAIIPFGPPPPARAIRTRTRLRRADPRPDGAGWKRFRPDRRFSAAQGYERGGDGRPARQDDRGKPLGERRQQPHGVRVHRRPGIDGEVCLPPQVPEVVPPGQHDLLPVDCRQGCP